MVAECSFVVADAVVVVVVALVAACGLLSPRVLVMATAHCGAAAAS